MVFTTTITDHRDEFPCLMFCGWQCKILTLTPIQHLLLISWRCLVGMALAWGLHFSHSPNTLSADTSFENTKSDHHPNETDIIRTEEMLGCRWKDGPRHGFVNKAMHGICCIFSYILGLYILIM